MVEKHIPRVQAELEDRSQTAEIERIREALRAEAEAQAKRPVETQAKQAEAEKPRPTGRSLSELEKTLLWLLKEIRPMTSGGDSGQWAPKRDTFLRLSTLICLGQREFDHHYGTISSTFDQLQEDGIVAEVDAGYTRAGYHRGVFLEPKVPPATFEDVQSTVRRLLQAAQTNAITPPVARAIFLLQKGAGSQEPQVLGDLERLGLCFKANGEIRTVDWFFRGPIPEGALKQAETELRLLQRESFARLSTDNQLVGLLLRAVLNKVLRGRSVGKGESFLTEAEGKLLREVLVFAFPGRKAVIVFDDHLADLLKARLTKDQMLQILQAADMGAEITPAQIMLILAGGLTTKTAGIIPVSLVRTLDGELYLLEDIETALRGRYFERHRPTLELIAFLQKETAPSMIQEATRRFVLAASEELPSLAPGDLFENFAIAAGFQSGLSLEQLSVSITPVLKALLPKMLSRNEVGALHLVERANNARVEWSSEDQAVMTGLVGHGTLEGLHKNGLLSSSSRPEVSPWIREPAAKVALAEVLSEEDWAAEVKRTGSEEHSHLAPPERVILQLIVGAPLATTISIPSATKETFASYLAMLGVDLPLYRRLRTAFHVFSTSRGLVSLFEFEDRLTPGAGQDLWQVITGKTKEELVEGARTAIRSSSFSEWVAALRGQQHKLPLESLLRTHVLTCTSDQKLWLTDVGYAALSEWFRSEQEELVRRLRDKGIPVEGETTTARLFKANLGGKLYTLVVAGAVEIAGADETYVQITSLDEGLKPVTETLAVRTGDTIILTGMLANPYKSLAERNSGIRRFVERGGTVIDIARLAVISALPQAGEIAHVATETLGHDLEEPAELHGALAELRGSIEAKMRKQSDQEREHRLKQEREREKELLAFDELMFAVFLGELEIETDAYVVEDGVRPFTLLFHGLPGCGKSARIDTEVRTLKQLLTNKGKPPEFSEISISRLVQDRDSAVEICKRVTESALLHGKTRPYVLVLKDLDALSEKKEASTATLAESQRVTAVLKDFFRQMFDRHDYQIGVLAEANSLNSIPEALLQFFPHRRVVLTPGFSKREEFFKKLQLASLETKLKRETAADPGAVAKFKDMYGLSIDDSDVRHLAGQTQGFTYRDLSVLARGIRQEMQQPDSRPLDIARKYKASLPQFLSIEVPHGVEPPQVAKEVWDKVGRAMLLDVDLSEGKPPALNPAPSLPFSLRPARGLLFSGPPGMGKTLLAKYIADKVKQYFIYLSPAEIYSKYVGESEKNLKEVFTFSRELGAAGDRVILFIDELDGFAPSREQAESRAIRSVLSVLLAELDGVQELTNVTVIGATNKPEDIDDALLRPGRFEEWIQFYPPMVHEAAEILRSHLGRLLPKDQLPEVNVIENVLGQESIKAKVFSQEAERPLDHYWSGADLALAARRSAYEVARSRDGDVLQLVEKALEELAKEKDALRSARAKRPLPF